MVNPLCLLLSPPSRIKAWDLLPSLTRNFSGVRSGKELLSSPRCLPGGPGCLLCTLVRSVDLSWVGGGSAVACKHGGYTPAPVYLGTPQRKHQMLPEVEGEGEQQAGGPHSAPPCLTFRFVIIPCKSGYRDVGAHSLLLGLCPALLGLSLHLGAQSQTHPSLGRGRRTGRPSTGDQELRAAEVPVLAQTAFPSPTQLPDRAVLSGEACRAAVTSLQGDEPSRGPKDLDREV